MSSTDEMATKPRPKQALQMSFEFQSEARVWIDMPAVDSSLGKGLTLKLTISQVASLYRMCGAALRSYSEQSSDVLLALADEAVDAR